MKLKNRIYLDCAATTPLDSEVAKAMAPYFSQKFGNPSSLHSFGQEAMAAVDGAREKIARAVGADFREIIFTGSATEANNLALRGIAKFARANVFGNQNNFAPAAKFSSPSARRPHFARTEPATPAGCSRETFALANKTPRIIVSAIEHPSILETARDLEKEGVEVIYLSVNKRGIVDLKKLKSSLNEKTILVSIMYANNEIGTIQPIAEISKIVRNFKNSKLPAIYPLVHTDAVQAFQFLDCDVNRLGVDLMTLSAHKIYGPKGIGLLYNPRFISPIITGGEQEFGLRSGTENVPAIVGFAKAIELAQKNREKEFKRLAELAKYFWHELKKIEPKAQINGGAPLDRLPNILNICFSNQNAEELLTKLDLRGLAAGAGSACAARAAKSSYVLQTIGLPEYKIKNSIRMSFGKFTSKQELKKALQTLKDCLK